MIYIYILSFFEDIILEFFNRKKLDYMLYVARCGDVTVKGLKKVQILLFITGGNYCKLVCIIFVG